MTFLISWLRGRDEVPVSTAYPLPVTSALDQSTPVKDSTEGLAYPDNFAHTITRNGDGTVNTDAFTDGTNTWTMTFGYTNGLVTSISRWVKT